MSWMHKLYETYEACAGREEFSHPDQPSDGPEFPALLPVSHVSQQAHIQVSIDGEGNFQRAELLPVKTSCIIPATEESAGRTSGDAPHPLDDKIHYCASDYRGHKKNLFPLYVRQLRDWCSSPQAHPMARAVLAYVEKGTLVHDLVEAGVLLADNNGKLFTAPPSTENAGKKDSIFSRLTPKKIDGESVRDQGEALVVWNVLLPGEGESRTWESRSLRQAWEAYDAARMEQQGLCLVQGNEVAITFKHPRNIRRPGDGAKLISSNDTSNFTFLGRFLEAAQASSVGYEVSQKAHLALGWLIRRQGYRYGEQVVVAWAISGAHVPNPCENFFRDVSDEELLSSTSSETATPTVVKTQTPQDMGQAFALRLGKALAGYRANLEDTTGIVIMTVEAASPGRLSVTFYREQLPDDYLENLRRWQTDCAWPQPMRLEKDAANKKPRTVWIPGAPVPRAIAHAAYGRRCDDKLLKATIERLLPCIVDGTPLPRDLVECCVRRACNRVAFEPWEWNEALAVACAVYKGWSSRTQNKEYDMALDENNINRDYLYGRLLAVAEYIERTALNAAGESRPTNAERLMQRFADHPCATWRQLEVQLSPYIQRLQGSSRAKLLFRAR
ncbi:MAG: type I-C CRISPR-associated protein Cas8c/Csd1, partial [Deltaproteobacteria bacterium]|nr:type I-C CRISPR-associated protein Cas8c/Csd1 [Deltaproteobacteria bacterium]